MVQPVSIFNIQSSISKVVLTASLFVWAEFTCEAQVISQFNWDSNPVTTAVVGPNATSVSSSATSSAGGAGGTNGLNAGLPKADLDFVIPTGGGQFDVAGIDISIDFQRDEGSGTLIRRGSSLIFGGVANLSVSYRVDDGLGGFNTVNSGNVYAVPNDNTYRTYRFYYIPTTGLGVITVDGVQQWSNDGPDNRNLYWTGAGNIIIGDALDGSGSNQAFLDNLSIASISGAPLPVELTNFYGEHHGTHNTLNWNTQSETDNDYFSIERSMDGKIWHELGQVSGAGNSNVAINYEFIDQAPQSGLNYYRLKQIDFDGQYEYSNTLVLHASIKEEGFGIYPTITNSTVSINGLNEPISTLRIVSMHGEDVTHQVKVIDHQTFSVASLSKGMYVIKSREYSTLLIKS